MDSVIIGMSRGGRSQAGAVGSVRLQGTDYESRIIRASVKTSRGVQEIAIVVERGRDVDEVRAKILERMGAAASSL